MKVSNALYEFAQQGFIDSLLYTIINRLKVESEDEYKQMVREIRAIGCDLGFDTYDIDSIIPEGRYDSITSDEMHQIMGLEKNSPKEEIENQTYTWLKSYFDLFLDSLPALVGFLDSRVIDERANIAIDLCEELEFSKTEIMLKLGKLGVNSFKPVGNVSLN